MAIAGAVTVLLLFWFGRTTENKKAVPQQIAPGLKEFDVQQFIDISRQKLSPEQTLYITNLEKGITRGDVPLQQVQAYNSLANFWKDSLKLLEPYLFYLGKAAKLDNSEKSLTFAGQIFLEALRGEQDESKLSWETREAIELFENAIRLNPNNDDLRIGLGSAYVCGSSQSRQPHCDCRLERAADRRAN